MDANTRYGCTRPKRGLFSRFHVPRPATLSVIDPRNAEPHRHRIVSRRALAALQESRIVPPGLRPLEHPVHRSLTQGRMRPIHGFCLTVTAPKALEIRANMKFPR